jgi:hypothetical protein
MVFVFKVVGSVTNYFVFILFTGFEVLDKTTNPNPCDPGEYNVAGSATNCTTCPGGSPLTLFR